MPLIALGHTLNLTDKVWIQVFSPCMNLLVFLLVKQ